MTEIYSGALTCMYTMLWLKMPFVDNMRQATCLKDEVLKFQQYDDPYKLLSFI